MSGKVKHIDPEARYWNSRQTAPVPGVGECLDVAGGGNGTMPQRRLGQGIAGPVDERKAESVFCAAVSHAH